MVFNAYGCILIILSLYKSIKYKVPFNQFLRKTAVSENHTQSWPSSRRENQSYIHIPLNQSLEIPNQNKYVPTKVECFTRKVVLFYKGHNPTTYMHQRPSGQGKLNQVQTYIWGLNTPTTQVPKKPRPQRDNDTDAEIVVLPPRI